MSPPQLEEIKMTSKPPSLPDVIKDEDNLDEEEDSETDTESQQACIPTPSRAKIRSKWFKAVNVISRNPSTNIR